MSCDDLASYLNSAECGVPFVAGDYVRLCGLKSPALNQKVGEIVEYIASTCRLGVLAHSDKHPKSIAAQNLTMYELSPDDRCPCCDDVINLLAFPPCLCGIDIDTSFKPSTCTSERVRARS